MLPPGPKMQILLGAGGTRRIFYFKVHLSDEPTQFFVLHLLLHIISNCDTFLDGVLGSLIDDLLHPGLKLRVILADQLKVLPRQDRRLNMSVRDYRGASDTRSLLNEGHFSKVLVFA